MIEGGAAGAFDLHRPGQRACHLEQKTAAGATADISPDAQSLPPRMINSERSPRASFLVPMV